MGNIHIDKRLAVGVFHADAVYVPIRLPAAFYHFNGIIMIRRKPLRDFDCFFFCNLFSFQMRKAFSFCVCACKRRAGAVFRKSAYIFFDCFKAVDDRIIALFFVRGERRLNIHPPQIFAHDEMLNAAQLVLNVLRLFVQAVQCCIFFLIKRFLI